jgi:endonuclease/exonuclease/phosphatase (EEP) superfamily protein YafD
MIQPRWQYWLARAIAWCVWAYLAMVIAVWLLLRLGGDRWWFATLVLFGPRWLCALPLTVLGPLAGLLRRRMLLPLAAAALLVFGPLMGFCLSWARLAAPSRPAIRVLTCNLKGHCNDNAALDDLIRDAAPDIVALQGCLRQPRVKWPAGWQVVQEGELLIASHYPLRDVRSSRPATRTPILSCTVATPEGDLDFATLHPQSPHQTLGKLLNWRTLLQPAQSGPLTQDITRDIEERRQDAEQAAAWIANDREPKIIVGDFNLPPESAIYRKYWTNYCDAFGGAGLGFGYTEWPRLRGKTWFGMRIDHILSTADWQPRRCWVGPDVGSDHLPLIAELCPGK